ncbi:hypothetical protein R5R35_002453 [Gryllus longicercus]|uniref:OTU domain-containing protein n=1 Tax=Gryllus longicercus TaxID=2509291 RepID=A0AAN9VHF8_9ORTH
MQGLWGYESIVDSPERLQFQMISFTLDPQWCGLLFSIYCRHEKTSVLGPDTFSTCTLTGPPLDADWIAFAGSIGVEICRLSSSWALIFETVKASGVILLLGVGSLVCYKLYHYYWPGSRSRLNSPNSSPPHSRYGENLILYHVRDDNQLVEDLDDEDISSIEGRYFGPAPVPSKSSLQHGIDVANFLRKSRFFSIIPSASHFKFGLSYDEYGNESSTFEESQMEKLSNSSSASSPCGLQHFRQGSWSMKHNMGPGLHRACLKEQKKTSKDNDSSWLMKRLKNMLSVSQGPQQLEHGCASLPVTPGCRLKHRNRDRKIVTNWEDGWKYAPFGMFRDNKPSNGDGSSMASRKSSFGSNCSPILIHSRITRDESCDSLGYSKRLPREGSFDSTCSELSLDISLPEAPNESSTMLCLDNLQEEIDQLKNHCLMMDEEFETIKCNRNLPGMSSLMNVNVNSNNRLENKAQSPHDALQETLAQENARACFAGLYSLTTIKNSTSSELSDSFTANGRASVGSAESLAWDSPIAVASPVKVGSTDDSYIAENVCVVSNPDNCTKPTMERVAEELECQILNSETASVHIEDNSMAELEWDEDGLDDFIEEEELEPTQFDKMAETVVPKETNSNYNSSEEHFVDPQITANDMVRSTISTSSFSERSSKAESSGFESKLTDSTITDVSSQWHCDWDQNINPWNNCALEESGFLEWDNNINCSRQPPRDWSEGRETIASVSEQSTPMSDVPNSEAISPMSNFPISTSNVTENVGPKVNIFEYAMREWQGHTKKAETILKGYAEIPSLLGVQYLRSIRGDNYCGVRAALFQVLSKGLPLPSGSTVYDYLSNACRMGNSKWLQNWNFAGRLPYESSNVLHGMKSCLESLDNMVSVLSSSEDRQQTLVTLLNRNPSLDLHLMEAAKLHMLMCAMELYEASSAGLDVPLFAMLMFARDTSETPRDLMNNHLKNVGNTGGLEQVEMFLLGYALQVTLRVVRPAAHGTEDFICCYPDWNLGVWPEVILIAEDDRHYNVLVN